MNLELQPMDLEIQEAGRTFAQEVLEPLAAEMDASGTLPESLLQEIRARNLLQPFLPEQAGGRDAGLFPLVLLLEETARVSPPVALLLAQQSILGIRATMRALRLPEHPQWAAKATRGEAIFSLAATEEQSGSDLTDLGTICKRLPDGSFEISGGKAYINWGRRAAMFFLLARTEEMEGPRTALFAIPSNSFGVEIGKTHATMGMMGIEAAPVRFDKVRVPPEATLGVYGFGSDLYDQLVNEMRIAVSAIATGIGQAGFDDAAGHARTRKQFGKPVGSFQSLQWRFADAATRIDASRLHVWQAVDHAAQKGSCFRQAAMAKIYATESACAVTDFALQVLGGRGYLRPNRTERLFRDARFLKIGLGTSEILRNRIAGQLSA